MNSAQNTVGVVMTYMTKSTVAVNVSSVGNLKAGQTKGRFDSILNQMSDTASRTKQDVSTQTKDADTVKKDLNSNPSDYKADNTKATDKSAMKDKPQTTDIKETGGKEANEELQSAIEEDGKKIVKLIADEIGISEEDVINAMEILGLTLIDLFNPENLTALVNNLGEAQDGLDLITDSDLFASLQNILDETEEMTSNLIEEFDITEEDLNKVLASLKERIGNTEENTAVVEKFADELDKAQEITSEKLANKAAEIETSDEQEIEVEVFKPVEESQQNNNNHTNTEASNPFNQIIQNITDAAAKVEEVPMDSYTDRAQMESIVRQITEKITVSFNENESSMELQLHPASLGNVNVLLTSSKDGIVAKFTAQNEIVKEAVESQMMQLQQKFDEQGIKVTSIEITIASHAFEQNLEQDNNKNQGEPEQKKTKGLRRINLAELDEEPEMTEAEMIAAQMMAYNGNSIDFSA